MIYSLMNFTHNFEERSKVEYLIDEFNEIVELIDYYI